MLVITMGGSDPGKAARHIFELLKQDGILVRDSYLGSGRIIIHTINMTAESAAYIADRLKAALFSRR